MIMDDETERAVFERWWHGECGWHDGCNDYNFATYVAWNAWLASVDLRSEVLKAAADPKDKSLPDPQEYLDKYSFTSRIV